MLLLGGSFDPVHAGHVALARYFSTLLHPDELRLLPAGRPWQKPDMSTPATDRIAMLKLAFDPWLVPVVIDEQEVSREGPSYAVDSLRALREEFGEDAAIVMALGADQLLNLHTWRDWPQLPKATPAAPSSASKGSTGDIQRLPRSQPGQPTRSCTCSRLCQCSKSDSSAGSISTQMARTAWPPLMSPAPRW